MPQLPLALAQGPAGDDPQADHEDKQHRPRADRHQGLQHEPGHEDQHDDRAPVPGVEVDPVEGAYASTAGVGE